MTIRIDLGEGAIQVNSEENRLLFSRQLDVRVEFFLLQ